MPFARRSGFAFGALALVLLLVVVTPGAAEEARDAGGGGAGETAGKPSATPPAGDPGKDEPLFHRVRVVGTPESGAKIPGSVTYLDRERLARHEYDDVHRTISQIPGINLQEEEGFGLRPNIGMRGTGVERSAKITLLEDGVLIAPAPYSAPSAYYFPTVGRMEGLEVRKGSSSIQQGPFTNGGVLNLLSTSIPSSFSGRANVALGSNTTLRGRAYAGESRERFGWLVEGFHMQSAGFKQVDGGGDSGFDLNDVMVKLRVQSSPAARRFQALELKLGHTEQEALQSYVGLTQADFDTDPFRRYAGSQQDRLDSDHDQVQARYFLRASRWLDVTATVYRNEFFRNWRKLEKVSGTSLSDVLGDPADHADELDILRADLTADSAADALTVRNNRRNYYSQGVHVVLGLHPGAAAKVHDVEVGVRYHEDEEDRFQDEDGFRMSAAGQMVQTSSGAPGSQSNRISDASAWALFVQDTISVGRWIVTPGVRVESIDFQRVDFGDSARSEVTSQRTNGVDVVIPGIGASYHVGGGSRVFAGIHRGFGPPGPGANQDTEAERSVNYELGYRREGPLRAQLVGFYNDYDNLLGACTVSSGCTGNEIGDLFNGGQVDVRGVEAALGYDLGPALGASVGLPLDLAYTFTQAEFRDSFDSDYDAWGQVTAGDELPYLPEHQASLAIGIVADRVSVFSNLIWVDTMRTVAGQGPIAREQSTDAHWLADLSLHYRFGNGLKIVAQVQNLFDEVYVAARRPSGARPGRDRNAMVGVVWDF